MNKIIIYVFLFIATLTLSKQIKCQQHYPRLESHIIDSTTCYVDVSDFKLRITYPREGRLWDDPSIWEDGWLYILSFRGYTIEFATKEGIIEKYEDYSNHYKVGNDTGDEPTPETEDGYLSLFNTFKDSIINKTFIDYVSVDNRRYGVEVYYTPWGYHVEHWTFIDSLQVKINTLFCDDASDEHLRKKIRKELATKYQDPSDLDDAVQDYFIDILQEEGYNVLKNIHIEPY
jgi:hypothetical protein